MLAVLSSGCVAIKQQIAIQTRLPGFVTLRRRRLRLRPRQGHLRVLQPDGARRLDGTAETDNGFDGDEQGAGRGQLLVGYRVPDGSAGPASFISLDGQLDHVAQPGATPRR